MGVAGSSDMDRLLANVSRRIPATTAAVAEYERLLGADLPREYVEFLRTTSGGEGFIGKNAYVILWGVHELASMNQAYEVERYVPGLLVFGSDGGGEAYGFDTRTPQWQIVQVPFVGMTWDLAEPMGATFTAYLERLYETERMREPIGHRQSAGADCRGKEIFDIKPIILGGSPTDHASKMVLNREDHIRAVVYWNRIIGQLREERSGG
jgi:hypothetical protein